MSSPKRKVPLTKGMPFQRKHVDISPFGAPKVDSGLQPLREARRARKSSARSFVSSEGSTRPVSGGPKRGLNHIPKNRMSFYQEHIEKKAREYAQERLYVTNEPSDDESTPRSKRDNSPPPIQHMKVFSTAAVFQPPPDAAPPSPYGVPHGPHSGYDNRTVTQQAPRGKANFVQLQHYTEEIPSQHPVQYMPFVPVTVEASFDSVFNAHPGKGNTYLGNDEPEYVGPQLVPGHPKQYETVNIAEVTIEGGPAAAPSHVSRPTSSASRPESSRLNIKETSGAMREIPAAAMAPSGGGGAVHSSPRESPTRQLADSGAPSLAITVPVNDSGGPTPRSGESTPLSYRPTHPNAKASPQRVRVVDPRAGQQPVPSLPPPRSPESKPFEVVYMPGDVHSPGRSGVGPWSSQPTTPKQAPPKPAPSSKGAGSLYIHPDRLGGQGHGGRSKPKPALPPDRYPSIRPPPANKVRQGDGDLRAQLEMRMRRLPDTGAERARGGSAAQGRHEAAGAREDRRSSSALLQEEWRAGSPSAYVSRSTFLTSLDDQAEERTRSGERAGERAAAAAAVAANERSAAHSPSSSARQNIENESANVQQPASVAGDRVSSSEKEPHGGEPTNASDTQGAGVQRSESTSSLPWRESLPGGDGGDESRPASSDRFNRNKKRGVSLFVKRQRQGLLDKRAEQRASAGPAPVPEPSEEPSEGGAAAAEEEEIPEPKGLLKKTKKRIGFKYPMWMRESDPMTDWQAVNTWILQCEQVADRTEKVKEIAEVELKVQGNEWMKYCTPAADEVLVLGDGSTIPKGGPAHMTLALPADSEGSEQSRPSTAPKQHRREPSEMANRGSRSARSFRSQSTNLVPNVPRSQSAAGYRKGEPKALVSSLVSGGRGKPDEKSRVEGEGLEPDNLMTDSVKALMHGPPTINTVASVESLMFGKQEDSFEGRKYLLTPKVGTEESLSMYRTQHTKIWIV